MGRKKALGVKRNLKHKFTVKHQTENVPKQNSRHNSLNTFKDRRFGERNPRFNKEQKYQVRFTKEREFLSKRSRRFELEEIDELALTHKGVRLDQYRDDYMDDAALQSSDDEAGRYEKVDDEIVEDYHFGDGAQKKEVFEDVIQKSKYHKMMRVKEKEDNVQLTADLNRQLENIAGMLKHREKKERGSDNYDNLIGELRNEYRMPSSSSNDQADQLRRSKVALESVGDFSLGDYQDFYNRLDLSDDVIQELDNFCK